MAVGFGGGGGEVFASEEAASVGEDEGGEMERGEEGEGGKEGEGRRGVGRTLGYCRLRI